MLRSRKAIALGTLLVGMFVGAAGANLAARVTETLYLDTGLFSVPHGTRGNFHLSLDAARSDLPATVLLQLINADGSVATSKQVTLAAGKTTTLAFAGPAMVRAHARILDPQFGLVDRRSFLATVELFDEFKSEQKFVCSVGEGGSGGRLPDP